MQLSHGEPYSPPNYNKYTITACFIVMRCNIHISLCAASKKSGPCGTASFVFVRYSSICCRLCLFDRFEPVARRLACCASSNYVVVRVVVRCQMAFLTDNIFCLFLPVRTYAHRNTTARRDKPWNRHYSDFGRFQQLLRRDGCVC